MIQKKAETIRFLTDVIIWCIKRFVVLLLIKNIEVMEIILFFCMLGASLLLGLCYGILYLPKKHSFETGVGAYNRVEEVLLKVHQPTLKIIISLLIVVLLGLSWQQACMIDERWYYQSLLVIIFLFLVYILALLVYACVHPYCLENESLIVGKTKEWNKRIHLVLAISFALISVAVIVYLLITGQQLNFMLFPAVFLLVMFAYALFWACEFVIKLIFFVSRLFAKLWQIYWDWVLKH